MKPDRERDRQFRDDIPIPIGCRRRGLAALQPWIQIVFVLLMLPTPVLAGQIYTWTDEDGSVHITDRPPEDLSRIENVIRYPPPAQSRHPSDPVPRPIDVGSQLADRLNKRIERLKDRKSQLEEIIEQNQASIAAAEKEVATFHKRSGSYARRNIKTIERQLLVLENNLVTYQNDLKYVEEDIAEAERDLKAIDMNAASRPKGLSGVPSPSEQ